MNAVRHNELTNKCSSETLTTRTTLSSRHKADYIKLNTRSKLSSRAQPRLVCVPIRMLFFSLSRCVFVVSIPLFDRSYAAAATSPLALKRRAGLLPAKDVPHRRPCRHRDSRPDIRCARPQVSPAKSRLRWEERRCERRPSLSPSRPLSLLLTNTVQ